MNFDVEGARKAGYSDKEIAEYLASKSDFDTAGAIKAGYGYGEVVDYLVKKPTAAPAPKQAAPTVLPDSDTSSDFVRGIRNYLPQLQETYGGAKVLSGLIAKKLGATDTGDALVKSGVETMDAGQAQQVVRESDSFLKAWEKGITTVITDWLPYQVGSGVANLAETLGFVGIGAGVGAVAGAGVGAAPGAVAGALSKTLVKQGVRDVAEKIAKERGEEAAQRYVQDQAKKALRSMGATAGMVNQAGLHGMGEVTSRAVEELKGVENVDLARVVPAAIAHGVADFFINKIGLDSLKIGEKASKYLAVDIAKRIGVTGLKEIPAEEIQALAERYGAELSLTDAEALREYVDTAAAAFGMSVVPGGVGGVRTHMANKFAELAKKNEQEADKTPSSAVTTTDLQNQNSQVDAELDASLRPTVTATGESTDAPSLLPSTPATTVTEEPKRKKGAAPAVEPAQAATDYLAAVDTGTVKPNSMKLNALMTSLGIEKPESGEGYVKRSIEAIKQHLTAQGAPSATGTEPSTAGIGAEVASAAPAAEIAGESTGAKPSGMAPAGTVATTTATGKGTQPVALTLDNFFDGLSNERVASFIPDTSLSPELRQAATQELQKRQTASAPAQPPAPAPAQPPAQPNKIEEIKTRRFELEMMIIDDDLPASHPKVKNKLAALNKLEQESGLTQSTYDNISFDEPGENTTLKAKRPTTNKGWFQHFLKTGQKDVSLVAVQNDTHPAFKYDPALSEEENLRAAVSLGEKYAQQEETDRQRALEESRQKSEPRYVASEQERQLYEQVRDEHNKQAQEHNNKRAELQKKYKEAKTEQEANTIEDELDALGSDQYFLPEWKNLEKDIYFDSIAANRKDNIYAHRVAADELINFYKGTRGRTETPLTASEQRVVKGYEDNRRQAGKLFGVSFPRWGDLSNTAKTAYLGQITNNAGLQQDQAFFAAGKQIINEKANVTAESKKNEQKTLEAHRERVRKEVEKSRAELERLQKQYERFADTAAFKGGLGYRLPNDVIEMLRKGNLQAAMEELSKKLMKNPDARNKMAGQILKLMSGLGLKTKVSIAKEPLSDGDLGQYDPMTDAIVLDPVNGLSVSTLIHEILHAASVKVMNLYMTGKKNQLTERQIKGVEQILKIMRQSQAELNESYPQAYDNPFEFLAYALSDRFFQADLEASGIYYGEVQAFDEALKLGLATEPITSILPEQKNMWSAFKRAIAGILNVPVGAMKSYSFLMELNAALEDIASAPTEPINIGQMAAKKAEAVEKGREVKGIDEPDSAYNLKEDQVPKGFAYWKKTLTTVPGWQQIATNFQNDRYFIRAWERTYDLAGKIYREGENKINNIYEQIVLSTGLARNFFNRYIADPSQQLSTAVGDFAKSMGLSTDEALNRLHRVLEALHEPERRMIKYLMNVPLSKAKTLAGGTISPAERRAQIIKLLDTKKLNKDQAKQLRAELDSIVFAKDQNGDIVYKDGVPQPSKYVDPIGDSPKAGTDKQGKAIKLSTDFTNEAMYSATGISPESASLIKMQYEKHPHKKEIDAVLQAIKTLTDNTAYLNKLSNYWSYPVDNRVNFYGWQFYAPFKGLTKSDDDQLDFHRMAKGREFQDLPNAMEGRFSVSNNPILQAMSDATRSSLRAGLKDVTLSVRNAIQQKMIPGEIERITFEDRQKMDPSKYKGQRTIFHYNEDGSIDVIKINNPQLLNSIRRTFEGTKPLVDIANKITSEIGKQHTRYNFQFAPMNFVRDALTNSFTIGAEMGPAAAAQFVKDITTMVVAKNGLYKAMQVAILYERGDAKSQAALDQLAKTDPYLKSMIEFINEGSMVSYLQSMSIKSNFQELHKEIGRSGIMKKKEQLEKFIDVWTDMFEIASRSAAYKIAKENALARGDTEQSAKVRAAAYAKNLANFEQVGTYGKALGAAYMFFRPAATGAVRAIEAVAPAFPGSVERALKRLPPNMDQEGKDAFLKNYSELAQNSRIMVAGLTALGMVAYAMASMTSDDDDVGRNAVATDNMQQWTRFARFHIPRKITEAMGIKEPVVFQMPWGFGLGAFMASGAQIAAWSGGRQSFKDMAVNIFMQISLDSFVPIPVSRMPVEEMPLNFFLDSIAPSVARPLLEFALNKNGLGQDIYNDQNRRFGDAYTGGDKIPEMYKEAARSMANKTTGEIDISPNTLYFLANSYIDGISRFAELVHGIADPKNSRPPFNPKTDLPLFGSFFGARSNVDSREFSKVEQKILDMEKKIKQFDTDPEMSINYDAKYPLNRIIVEMYNNQINGELKNLRSKAKETRFDTRLPAETRRDLVKMYTLQQNLVKRDMIEKFKAYGVEP